MQKRVLIPARLRRVPAQFSWLDQRLVRDGHLGRCDCTALALYLLLVSVADAQGLSYYADRSIERLLSLEPQALERAREQLVRAGLIAFEAPLYQVLSLQTPAPAPAPAQASRPAALSPRQDPRSRERASAALRRLRAQLDQPRQTLP